MKTRRIDENNLVKWGSAKEFGARSKKAQCARLALSRIAVVQCAQRKPHRCRDAPEVGRPLTASPRRVLLLLLHASCRACMRYERVYVGTGEAGPCYAALESELRARDLYPRGIPQARSLLLCDRARLLHLCATIYVRRYCLSRMYTRIYRGREGESAHGCSAHSFADTYARAAIDALARAPVRDEARNEN